MGRKKKEPVYLLTPITFRLPYWIVVQIKNSKDLRKKIKELIIKYVKDGK